jgi:hypothetical protein
MYFIKKQQKCSWHFTTIKIRKSFKKWQIENEHFDKQKKYQIRNILARKEDMLSEKMYGTPLLYVTALSLESVHHSWTSLLYTLAWMRHNLHYRMRTYRWDMVYGQFVILGVSVHCIRVHWTHVAKRAELLRDSSVLLYRYETRWSVRTRHGLVALAACCWHMLSWCGSRWW